MDFNVPELGEGVYEAEFVSWHVKPGDKVKRGQVLMEVMTDKATCSPFANHRAEGGTGPVIKVGRPILSYTVDGEERAPEASTEKKERRAKKTTVTKAETVPAAAPVPVANGPKVEAPLATLAVKAAPSVRLMARKLGIDLGNIPGTGPGGRVLLEDLTRFVRTPGTAAPTTKPAAEPPPDYGSPGAHIKLIGLRRRIQRVVQSKRTIPHYSKRMNATSRNRALQDSGRSVASRA